MSKKKDMEAIAKLLGNDPTKIAVMRALLEQHDTGQPLGLAKVQVKLVKPLAPKMVIKKDPKDPGERGVGYYRGTDIDETLIDVKENETFEVSIACAKQMQADYGKLKCFEFTYPDKAKEREMQNRSLSAPKVQ